MNKNTDNNCPCCGNPLLRHARQGGMYWFCTSCWQEVPILAVSKLPVSEVVERSQPKQQVVKSGIEA
jgi:ribosomal protein L37AE/L43A